MFALVVARYPSDTHGGFAAATVDDESQPCLVPGPSAHNLERDRRACSR